MSFTVGEIFEDIELVEITPQHEGRFFIGNKHCLLEPGTLQQGILKAGMKVSKVRFERLNKVANSKKRRYRFSVVEIVAHNHSTSNLRKEGYVAGDVVRNVPIHSDSVMNDGYVTFFVEENVCKLKPLPMPFKEGDVLEKAVCERVQEGTAYFAVNHFRPGGTLPICPMPVQKVRWRELAFGESVVLRESDKDHYRFLKAAEGTWEMVVPVSDYHKYLHGKDKMGPVAYIEKNNSKTPCYVDSTGMLPLKLSGVLTKGMDDKKRSIQIVLHGFIDKMKLHIGTYCHYLKNKMYSDLSKEAVIAGNIEESIWEDCDIKCSENLIGMKNRCGPCNASLFKTIQEKIGTLTVEYQKIFSIIVDRICDDRGEIRLYAETSDPEISDQINIRLLMLVDAEGITQSSKSKILSVAKGLLFVNDEREDLLVAQLSQLTAYPVSFTRLDDRKVPGTVLGRISHVRPVR